MVSKVKLPGMEKPEMEKVTRTPASKQPQPAKAYRHPERNQSGSSKKVGEPFTERVVVVYVAAIIF